MTRSTTPSRSGGVIVRNTRPEDIGQIEQLSRLVYGERAMWTRRELVSHLRVFPEGQLVAVDVATHRVVGMAASLIVVWDDYDLDTSWDDFTDDGMFTNHDPEHGRTLYGAEVMVDPHTQGKGVGKKIYAARRELCRRLRLLRIRAGARLRGYRRYARRLSAEQYVVEVVRGRIGDPTLSFQLRQGFHVLGVIGGYIEHDRESLGYAAVIEWINHAVATPRDYRYRDARFARPRKP